MNLTEEPLDEEMLQNLRGAAEEGGALVGVDVQLADASSIIARIDGFVFDWQQGKRGTQDQTLDLSLPLGSLWGEQLVRSLGWQ